MANSLRSKIKKLYHDNNISEKMFNELLEKLEGHDRELRAKAIDEFAEKLNNSIDMLDLNYEYRCDGGIQHQTLNNIRTIIQELL